VYIVSPDDHKITTSKQNCTEKKQDMVQ